MSRLPGTARGLALLLAGAAACGSTESGGRAARGAPAPLEDPAVLAAEKAELGRVEVLFRQNDAGYAAARTALITRNPAAAPWLAKAMVAYARLGQDELQKAGLMPEQVERVKPYSGGLIFRARNELVVLGEPARRAIDHYLLRSRIGPDRDLGRYLLQAHPDGDVLGLLQLVVQSGEPAAKREALEMLASYDSPAAKQLLEQAIRSDDFRVRGTAVRSLARWRKSLGERGVGTWLWQVARQDADTWVRQQAFLALGDLGDFDQVRPLVDALERLLQADKGREAEAVTDALRRITRTRYEADVAAWRRWLGDR
jgi:hypothetical protein